MDQRTHKLLHDAQFALQNRRPGSAIIAIGKILKHQPEQADALLLKAQYEQSQLAFDRALHTLKILLKNETLSSAQLRFLAQLCNQFELFFLLEVALKRLCDAQPEVPQLHFQLGLCQAKVGKIDAALQQLLDCQENGFSDPMLDINFGHVYKAKGNTEQAAKYYQRFIHQVPSQAGTGYWSLADLKAYHFNEDDDKAMALAMPQLKDEAQKGMLYLAIGRSLEQQGKFERAFDAYTHGNQLIAPKRPFRGEGYLNLVASLNIEHDAPSGRQTSECRPVFIVGLPRSGTTLTEQILASHSQVSCTDELPFIERIAIQMSQGQTYSEGLARLTTEQINKYREFYLCQVGDYCKVQGGVFIDKNPTNFLHIGLITRLFPEAKIISLLRDPIDNAMSVYKQFFSKGNDFSYRLEDIITYTQGYLRLLAKCQHTLPRTLFMLSYEKLVAQPQQTIKTLLAFCDLPFEQQCLRFYEHDRPVLTPSSSQVRQPINNNAINSAQRYSAFISSHSVDFEALRTDITKLLE